MRLGRDKPTGGERWASIDALDTEQAPSTSLVNLYLDPGICIFNG